MLPEEGSSKAALRGLQSASGWSLKRSLGSFRCFFLERSTIKTFFLTNAGSKPLPNQRSLLPSRFYKAIQYYMTKLDNAQFLYITLTRRHLLFG